MQRLLVKPALDTSQILESKGIRDVCYTIRRVRVKLEGNNDFTAQ